MSHTVKENAKSAREADDLATNPLQSARSGLKALNAAIPAVTKDDRSSEPIVDLMGVTHDITPQSNFLYTHAHLAADGPASVLPPVGWCVPAPSRPGTRGVRVPRGRFSRGWCGRTTLSGPRR